MIASDVTLLPHPDSPTTPMVSWAWTSNVTPRTAWTRPDEDENSTSRSRTERSGSSLAVRPATEGGHLAEGHRLSLGSRASRRPSPSRLKPSTEMTIAMPGKSAVNAAPEKR